MSHFERLRERTRRHWLQALAATALTPRWARAAEADSAPEGRVLQVGPGRDVRTIAEASRMARDGDTVIVDSGTYTADVAVWTQQGLQLRTAGGRVRLLAAGASAEGKGTWVVRGEMSVEGFDFHGARVRDHNGAGIRFERGRLTVRDCLFSHNQVGLQTNNDPQSELTVEHCELAHNLRPDGHNHQLYAGNIGSLTVRGCYFHHGFVGHLLKSRAAFNNIYCNRLTDEGGRASYELEFPNGGVAVVVGNLIAQSALTENDHLISYGAEGYRWAANELYLAHNTLIDGRARGGVFLRVSPGADRVVAVNNVLLGAGRLDTPPAGDFRNNPRASRDDLVDPAGHDLRLQPRSRLRGRTVAAGVVHGLPLSPMHEYGHPRELLALEATASNPGAFQGTAAALSESMHDPDSTQLFRRTA